ncbi:MAG: cytochrome C oxidase subunit I [Bacteroidetes bacterium]|nr:cytochrome C oxidase subunit I [Bacteroidota bacterium]MBS1540207.1 cytochrome C oxidase subunit I [Bacteroidota bacterium]
MIVTPGSSTHTSSRVVIPFYVYAALCFLLSAVLLLLSADVFQQHYFHPKILAITHLMAIGWGTMVILGASHQLVPVICEGKLYSEKLAYVSFALAAIGIPILVYGFFTFNMGNPAKWGGRFVVLAFLSYLINLGKTIANGKSENVHAIFVFTSVFWLFLTAFFGLALVYNFTYPLMPHDSLHYLPLHAHAGVVGWFLLLVIGVGSRLIPMFLISKYSNPKLLWVIYFGINGALISYIFIFYFVDNYIWTFVPGLLLLISILLFVRYAYQAFHYRIRKQVDDPMRLSLLSVTMAVLPIFLLIVIIVSMVVAAHEKTNVVLAYGFMIFFGWITAIILGMTFKTLPFIVWNKIYHNRAAFKNTPNPKDLVSSLLFKAMGLCYIIGFVLFIVGVLAPVSIYFLQGGALLLVFTAIFYNWNVMQILWHRPTP